MAVSTLSDYYGSTLAGLITANAAAIAADLGITEAAVSNPDALLGAVVKKTKAWLTADGTTDNGTEITGYGTNGASSKIAGSGDRAGQLGYQDQITFYVPDPSPAAIDPSEIY